MTTSTTVRRIVALTASVALFATAPAGIAMANENGSGSGSDCNNSSTTSSQYNSSFASFKGNDGLQGLTATQLTAVQNARAAYIAS
ncbi:MAG: hypothetical protein PSX37_06925, partial [bacterium]|nr:hypothetical protein [bacterium]